MYTVGLYTLGCKVAQYETDAVREAFLARGFEARDFSEECDVYVINTCTVTEDADRKSRQFIRRAIRKNPKAHVIAMGCYTERSADEVLGIPGVSAVIGTHAKLSAVPVAEGLIAGTIAPPYNARVSLSGAPFEKMSVKRAKRTRAYVKIEDGCNSKCSYCAIKEARGAIRSKPSAEVIREVEEISASGTLEVVLTGIETAAYGIDFPEKYTLCDLLSQLERRGSCKRVRLGSLAPELIGEEFAKAVSGLKILVPHFHVSLQSGSDSVLRAMRRRYTRTTALANIKRLKKLIPEATFTADMMVGFPGESEEDFLETVSFVREAGLLDVHVFTFSAREGTAAYDMKGLPKAIKHERTRRLIVAKNEVRDGVLSEIVSRGVPLSSIFETERDGIYTAHSDTFIEVRATSDTDISGELHLVKPISHADGIIYGEILKND